VVLGLLFCALLLGCTIILPVFLNSATTQVESAVGKLDSQQKQLAAETSSLSAQVSALSSPDRVAEQAARLGLEPAHSVYYVEAGTPAVATGSATAVAGR
jgi:cell division protein FtsL